VILEEGVKGQIQRGGEKIEPPGIGGMLVGEKGVFSPSFEGEENQLKKE